MAPVASVLVRLPLGLPIVLIIVQLLTVPAQSSSTSDNNLSTNSLLQSGPLQCEYYNWTCVLEATSPSSKLDAKSCYGIRTCPSQDHYCYVVWMQSQEAKVQSQLITEHLHRSNQAVKLMGCYENEVCKLEMECVAKRESSDHNFCCCSGHMCNENFISDVVTETTVTTTTTTTEKPTNADSKAIVGFVVGLCVSVVLLVMAVAALCMCKKLKKNNQNLGTTDAERQGADYTSSNQMLECEIEFDNEQSQIGKGRFGRVYKGIKKDDGQIVAIKTFGHTVPEKESWKLETEVYMLPRMEHENILKFVGTKEVGTGLDNKEYWLVTEYHKNGSLYDYLTKNTVSWAELLRIAHSMTCGLAHLHEQLSPRGNLDVKVAVAHRDFKSKNVLLKSDLNACIGDFGLARIFEPDKDVGDQHAQVGTHRYMAPEVLGGAIYYTRDQFLQIDMYACGLVLWELASRCRLPNSEPGPYKLPFEDIFKQGCQNNEFKVAVVDGNKRPDMPWEKASPGMSQLAEIIRDCLAREPESRRSAANVVERLKVLMQEEQNENAVVDREEEGVEQMEMVPLVANGSVYAQNSQTPPADA